MEMTFDSDAALDFTTDSFIFFGHADKEPIRCAITLEAMTFGLGVPPNEASTSEAFKTHREEIYSIASRLIREKRWEPNGGILIGERDIS